MAQRPGGSGLERAWGERTVGARFAAIAARLPARPALATDGTTLTFEALDRAANRLAHHLLAALGPGEVPVLLDRLTGARPFIAVLAAAKAGKPFAVAGPALRDEMRQAIVDDLGPGLVLGEGDIERADGDPTAPPMAFDGERAASIVYTSGSTAAPKGVVRTHANLLHRAWIYHEASGVGPGDVQALMAPLSHVGAESDLFGAWLNGAMVHHRPAAMGVAGLEPWLREAGVTLWHPPVGLLRRWLGLLEGPAALPALRLVALGGEPIHWGDVRRLRAACGASLRLLHRYSSSEAGNIASLEVGDPPGGDEGVVPAGFASPDKTLEVSPSGEVVVRSAYLSRGYWRGAAFDGVYHTGDVGALDATGCLHLRGRRDRRVKVRGFLVDLTEVEGALQAIAGVREVAVVADDDRLLAYVVGGPPDVREQARRRLAPWMLPTAFLAVPQLPLTATGKVDHQALPRPAVQAIAPREGLERELVAAWRAVLGRDDAGATDSFLALGGDSLRAAELAARVARLAGREVPTSAVYWAPTPSAMRQAIEHDTLAVGRVVPLADGPGEPWLLLPPAPAGTTLYRDLAQALGAPVFSCDATWEAHELPGIAAGIAAELEARWPGRRWRLGGYSLGGNLAFEVARLLGERAACVVLLDSLAPGFRSGRERDHGPIGNKRVLWQHTFQCWWWEFRTWRRLAGADRAAFGRATWEALRPKLTPRFIWRRLVHERPTTLGPPGARHVQSGTFDGPVHVLRFRTQYPGSPRDPYLGWRPLVTGPLSAASIDGIHLLLMFQRCWVAAIAAAMRQGAQEATDG